MMHQIIDKDNLVAGSVQSKYMVARHWRVPRAQLEFGTFGFEKVLLNVELWEKIRKLLLLLWRSPV